MFDSLKTLFDVSSPPQKLRVPSRAEVGDFITAASLGKNIAVINFLDEYPDSVDVKSDLLNRTALMYAAGAGHASTVQLLRNGGASIDEMDIAGKTAVMLAKEYGCAEIVVMLERWARHQGSRRGNQTPLPA